jgi:hypothetical protein
MTAASDLWAAVVARYDADGLITLTNIRDSGATVADGTVGLRAAQSVVDLWPIYAQADFDSTNAQHIEAGVLGVIAVLWRRGGSASAIEQVKWDEVFGDQGVVARLRRVSVRGRLSPRSNSGVQQKAERDENGQAVRGWSDRESLPVNYLPTRTGASEE